MLIFTLQPHVNKGFEALPEAWQCLMALGRRMHSDRLGSECTCWSLPQNQCLDDSKASAVLPAIHACTIAARTIEKHGLLEILLTMLDIRQFDTRLSMQATGRT